MPLQYGIIHHNANKQEMSQNPPRERSAKSNVLWRSSFTLSSTIEASLYPLTVIATLLLVAVYYDDRLGSQYVILAALSFALAFPGDASFHEPPRRILRKMTLSWLMFIGIMSAFGIATGYIYYYPLPVLATWFVATPVVYTAAYFALKSALPRVISMRNYQRTAIIVGRNDIGIRLARQFVDNPYLGTHIIGFFDDRNSARLQAASDRSQADNPLPIPTKGRLCDLTDFIKQNHVETIYIALPMATQPRILHLLDDLRDTTASIYFVPDIFVTDLIQGRLGSVGDMPVVAVCETPFTGFNGIIKRTADIVLSLLILLLLLPVMLILAIGVKLSSPGPVIFKQRRYGLDGKEILVYKFRSMTSCDDGAVIRQATKDDQRITRFGAFMRRTSMDELPQFLNVLQGRMSIVGPRPHAVAHNETYRKLIKGYMVRHKVRPGITGWAQVNGYRGETETVDKMEKRIEYDLEYLRNWSLSLDLWIILKTAIVALKGQNAH
ncbi:MAG: undecaprenyl-phosphate glucose phosphotransferase [Azoarcus sp.]|jgi:putative colanic acid biosynthesis UDP-glucose lipid carrier transferase|nr:undecaprenyl-phosphate glucose phosphotransferase [Azoarcus sp.]